MYLQSIAFLHTDMTQVVEILPHVRQELTYILHSLYHWVLMSWWRNEPWHQQPWYCLCWTEIIQSLHFNPCHVELCLGNIMINIYILSNLWYRAHLSRQLTCWSLRCSWSIACRRCSNYIFILDLTPGFNGCGEDRCKMSEWVSKFNGLSGDSGEWGPDSPYKPCNHSLKPTGHK